MSENQNQSEFQSAQTPQSEAARKPVEVRQLDFGNSAEQVAQNSQPETKQVEPETKPVVESVAKPAADDQPQQKPRKSKRVKVGYEKGRESAFRKASEKRKRQPINADRLACLLYTSPSPRD